MSQVQEKPWSIQQFEEYRTHMTNWVRTEISPYLSSHNFNIRRLLIHGQVKVGKREIVEYIALRDHNDPNRCHIFISSFHRKADESQRRELEAHDVKVFSIYSSKKQTAVIEFIEDQLVVPDIRVIIHWDECDYGTGERQTLAKIYKHFRDNERVCNILYSATPEELLYSREIATEDSDLSSFVSDFYEEGIVKPYDPPFGYCGASEFMAHNLVSDATPFFDVVGPNQIVLTAQAKEILTAAKKQLRITNKRIRDLQDELFYAEEDENEELAEELREKIRAIKPRNIIVVRISYKNGDDDDDETDDDSSYGSVSQPSHKAIYPFLRYSRFIRELEDVAIYADKKDVEELEALPNVLCDTIKWSKKVEWDRKPKDQIVLVVHDQTSTRSTEWVFHDRLFATHDYRKRITFNTVLQAQLRSAHYVQNYGGFQPIRIYGHLKTFKLCAGLITAADYLTNEWIVRKIPKSNPPRYRLKNPYDKNAVLPENMGGCLPDPDGYTFEFAQRMLIALGCTNNGGTKMSQRVRGNAKQVPEIISKFYPCEPHQKNEKLREIMSDPEMGPFIYGHRFNGKKLFEHGQTDGQWNGYLRGDKKVLTYEKMSRELWGIRMDGERCRLTVCYRGDQVGLCLRAATGAMKEVSDLESYKSMYCVD